MTKAKAFAKIYTNPNSPVKYRVVRSGMIRNGNLRFEVRARLDDNIWYGVDILTCEDDAFALVESLYLYGKGEFDDLIGQVYCDGNSPHDG